MPNDLTKSNILFPFTPESEGFRSEVAGINDCFMVIPAEGATGSPAGPREYSVYLNNMIVNASDVTYVFRASFPGGVHTKITFIVTRGNGVVRVNTTHASIHAVLIVDSDNMYPTPGSFTLTSDPDYAEIEPAKIVWRTDRLTQIIFKNAERKWDPNTRVDPPATSTVLTVTGGPLRFKSGYNVSLQYNEDIETLYVRGIPGAGDGYPETIPWDIGPSPAEEGYIRSINGLSGSVKIAGSDNLLVQTADDITLEVQEPLP